MVKATDAYKRAGLIPTEDGGSNGRERRPIRYSEERRFGGRCTESYYGQWDGSEVETGAAKVETGPGAAQEDVGDEGSGLAAVAGTPPERPTRPQGAASVKEMGTGEKAQMRARGLPEGLKVDGRPRPKTLAVQGGSYVKHEFGAGMEFKRCDACGMEEVYCGLSPQMWRNQRGVRVCRGCVAQLECAESLCKKVKRPKEFSQTQICSRSAGFANTARTGMGRWLCGAVGVTIV